VLVFGVAWAVSVIGTLVVPVVELIVFVETEGSVVVETVFEILVSAVLGELLLVEMMVSGIEVLETVDVDTEGVVVLVLMLEVDSTVVTGLVVVVDGAGAKMGMSKVISAGGGRHFGGGPPLGIGPPDGAFNAATQSENRFPSDSANGGFRAAKQLLQERINESVVMHVHCAALSSTTGVTNKAQAVVHSAGRVWELPKRRMVNQKANQKKFSWGIVRTKETGGIPFRPGIRGATVKLRRFR